MAKNNQNGYVSWRVFTLTVGVLVVIIGGMITLSIAMSDKLSDIPCRNEVLDADKQLRRAFEKRDNELKEDFIRALEPINARQGRLEVKIDQIYERIGGLLAEGNK
jgi:hypothetical protein